MGLKVRKLIFTFRGLKISHTNEKVRIAKKDLLSLLNSPKIWGFQETLKSISTLRNSSEGNGAANDTPTIETSDSWFSFQPMQWYRDEQ